MTIAADLDMLRAAICRDPHDDVLRLAYADALDERGEKPDLAEFIRLDLNPATVNGIRHQQLVDRNRLNWAGALCDLTGVYEWGGSTSLLPWRWTGGLPGSVICSFARWYEMGASVVAAVPLTRVEFNDKTALGAHELQPPMWLYRKSATMDYPTSDELIDELPQAVFDLLRNGLPSCGARFDAREYATLTHANGDLSRAAVNWARQQAGLPLLGGHQGTKQ